MEGQGVYTEVASRVQTIRWPEGYPARRLKRNSAQDAGRGNRRAIVRWITCQGIFCLFNGYSTNRPLRCANVADLDERPSDSSDAWRTWLVEQRLITNISPASGWGHIAISSVSIGFSIIGAAAWLAYIVRAMGGRPGGDQGTAPSRQRSIVVGTLPA